MIDPRIEGMKTMLKDVAHIIPVVSGKGGVGKSLVSTTMALILSRIGKRVGLLDLDFHGASVHEILGTSIEKFPEEKEGILPEEVYGIKLMTIAYYSKDHPTPLRGKEITDVILEILSITRWGTLDYLIIDMPPGLGDTFLDTIRFFRRGEYIIVSTPSRLSMSVVRRLIQLLKEQNMKILGLIENMKHGEESSLVRLAVEFGIKYLGKINFYPDLDEKIGNPDLLLESKFAQELGEIVEEIFIK